MTHIDSCARIDGWIGIIILVEFDPLYVHLLMMTRKRANYTFQPYSHIIKALRKASRDFLVYSESEEGQMNETVRRFMAARDSYYQSGHRDNNNEGYDLSAQVEWDVLGYFHGIVQDYEHNGRVTGGNHKEFLAVLLEAEKLNELQF